MQRVLHFEQIYFTSLLSGGSTQAKFEHPQPPNAQYSLFPSISGKYGQQVGWRLPFQILDLPLILLSLISHGYVLSISDETKFKDFIKDYLTKTKEISSSNKATHYVPLDESIDSLYRQCLKCHVVSKCLCEFF